MLTKPQQGLAACEHVIDHLAEACGVSGEEIREQNIYSDGDQTPFGMIMGKEFAGQWNVPKMWQRLYHESDYTKRKEAIDDFNAKNIYKKRGISMLPTKFGIAFTAKFMNQGGALVHLYTDGTVLISHGGTEMVSELLFSILTLDKLDELNRAKFQNRGKVCTLKFVK